MALEQKAPQAIKVWNSDVKRVIKRENWRPHQLRPEVTTEWWFFYSDWVYYWDKYDTQQTKVSNSVFENVLYDRKYDTRRGRSWTTYGIIKSDFSWFDWTTYTLYDWGAWRIVIKWEYVIFSGKDSSWYQWARKTYAFNRSTKALLYNSSTASGSWQYSENLYSYIPTEHRYPAYWTWNASYVYYVDLANNNTITSQSYWYNQVDVFYDKVLVLSENASLWVKIYSIDWTSYATYGSSTFSNPNMFIYDSWLVDDYSSSDVMYWKVAVTWCRSNRGTWVIADMINNTITAYTMKSDWWIRGIFVPYTSISWYTHLCCFGWDYWYWWIAKYNSANGSYDAIYKTSSGWSAFNVMSDWSIFFYWDWAIYDIDTWLVSTHTWLYWYVWRDWYKC